ncbi:3-oxoacyl-ACP reductase [Psychrobium sp. MM17-31]|uniref:3-oxoacyl-ACP reductase n=1 Tax=Psychrobium sp. MM17-31 TaxID=2917758 RepID=UPI001EF6965B|nr:3-oxoacyl-ACP reductase [Psychrobium sp. MM17-31]
MKDGYLNFSHSKVGKTLFSILGLTVPPKLARYSEGDELVKTSILVNDRTNLVAIQQCFPESNISVVDEASSAKVGGLVFDATTITTPQQLVGCYEFFNQQLGRLITNGRIVIIGSAIDSTMSVEMAASQRALVGIVKSIAKELGRKGCSANVLYAKQVSEQTIAAPLRFLMSDKSTYVSGQVIAAGEVTSEFELSQWHKPLAGKTALVTGASRGIGAAIASTLAADGAQVIGLDIPQAKAALEQHMSELGGQSILLDVTASDAPQQLASALDKPLDIVVHNAGITRDKTLKRMSTAQWQSVVDINLGAVANINQHFFQHEVFAPQAKIVCVASISGIAGNVGQVNYAASKAGIIGLVEATAQQLQVNDADITINAVAPGFIETEMTAKIPLMTRHFGRRLCSLSQGGLPQDVANTIAFLASPNAQAINGNTIRVCGQNLMGA